MRKKKEWRMSYCHTEKQPIPCALQRVSFAPVPPVSAWTNLLEQGHNRNTDRALITI